MPQCIIENKIFKNFAVGVEDMIKLRDNTLPSRCVLELLVYSEECMMVITLPALTVHCHMSHYAYISSLPTIVPVAAFKCTPYLALMPLPSNINSVSCFILETLYYTLTFLKI